MAVDVVVDDLELRVTLRDGHAVTVPLARFPRLAAGTAESRSDWRLIGGGEGIHWDLVDEDISVAALLRHG